MTISTTTTTPTVTVARYGLARPELEDARVTLARVAPGREDRVWAEVLHDAEALTPGTPTLRDVIDAFFGRARPTEADRVGETGGGEWRRRDRCRTSWLYASSDLREIRATPTGVRLHPLATPGSRLHAASLEALEVFYADGARTS